MTITRLPSLAPRGRTPEVGLARRDLRRRERTPPVAFALAGLFALFAPGPAAAQQVRIAYLTSWRIIGPEAEFQGSRDAEQALSRDVESWNRELEERKQEIQSLEKDIEQKRLVISESKRQELEQQRSQKRGEYERRAKEIYGEGGLIDRRNSELTKAIYDKVKEAVAIISREEGYDFVFDGSDNNIWWSNKDYDITDRVLAKLNEAAKSGPGAAPEVSPLPPQLPPGAGDRPGRE